MILPDGPNLTNGEMRALVAPLFNCDMEELDHVWIIAQKRGVDDDVEIIGCPKHAMWGFSRMMSSVITSFPDGFTEDDPCGEL